MMAGFNPLQMIMQAAQGQNSALTAGIGQNQAATDEMSRLFQQSAVETDSGNEQTASAHMKAAGIERAKGGTLEQIQQLYNLDLQNPTNALASNLATIKQAQEAYGPARAEFDQAQQTGLLDNPLQYIINQIRLPQMAAKVNAIADAEDRAIQDNQMRLAGQAAAKSTIIAATSDAEYEMNMQRADAAARKARAASLESQAQNIGRISASNMQTLSLVDKRFDNQRQTAVSLQSIQDAAENRALRIQQMAIAQEDRMIRRAEAKESSLLRAEQFAATQEERAARRAERTEVAKGKQEKQAQIERLDARFTDVAGTLGMVEPPTVATLDKFGTPKYQEKLYQFATTGTMGESLAESLPFYLGQGGANPGVLRKTGAASIYDTAVKLQGTALGKTYEAAALRELQKGNQGGKAPKPEDLRKMAFDLYQLDITNSMLVKKDDPAIKDLASRTFDNLYNPYKAQFLSMATQIDAGNGKWATLKDNVVHKYVKARLSAGPVTGENGNNLNAQDQQAIMKAITEEISTRKLDPKVAAAQVSAYFKAAANFNYELNKYNLFGLQPQSAYQFTLEGSFFKGDERQKLDLTDPQQVENAFQRSVRKRTVSNAAAEQVLDNPVGKNIAGAGAVFEALTNKLFGDK